MEKAAAAIRAVGRAGECWLVGGAVRDDLLGLPPGPDVDVVVVGDATTVAQELYDAGLAEGPPVVYARFGTAMVKVDGVTVELATSRAESYTPGSRKPAVRAAPLEQDAQRRDFTVNALMRSAEDGRLLDLLGTGLDDLGSKLLRCPVDPATSFRDDPLRTYRAVRFAAQLGFRYAEGLPDAIRSCAVLARGLSRERVRDELSKILVLPSAGRALDDLLEFGLLDGLTTEFRAMRAVGVCRYHHLDAWAHTCQVVEACPPDLVTRLAAWLHDVGKPKCHTVDAGGEHRFFGHEVAGAETALGLLRDLRYPGETVERVVRLVRGHMRLSHPETMGTPGYRRLVRDFGDDLPRLLDLVEADRSALRPGVVPQDLGPVRERLAAVGRESPAETLVSPLDGNEIKAALKIGDGPAVGAWKRALAEAVVNGELIPGDRQAALAWLAQRHNVAPVRPVGEAEPHG